MLRYSFRKTNEQSSSDLPIQQQPQQQQQYYYQSKTEEAILNAKEPIKIDEDDQEIITLFGQRGVWLNKKESLNWPGNLISILI
jgi:hypothetical protein